MRTYKISIVEAVFLDGQSEYGIDVTVDNRDPVTVRTNQPGNRDHACAVGTYMAMMARDFEGYGPGDASIQFPDRPRDISAVWNNYAQNKPYNEIRDSSPVGGYPAFVT